MKREDRLRKLAQNAYKNHTLVENNLTRWSIRQPDTSVFWQTFMTTAGRLVIVGDGPDLIFNAGNRPGRSMLSWLATSNEDYLADKVLPHRVGWTWDELEALTEVREHLAEARAEGEDGDSSEIRGLEALLEDYGEGDGEYEFWRIAHDHLQDAYEYNFGRCPVTDIYYARAAAARLLDLLDAIKGGEE